MSIRMSYIFYQEFKNLRILVTTKSFIIKRIL